MQHYLAAADLIGSHNVLLNSFYVTVDGKEGYRFVNSGRCFKSLLVFLLRNI